MPSHDFYDAYIADVTTLENRTKGMAPSNRGFWPGLYARSAVCRVGLVERRERSGAGARLCAVLGLVLLLAWFKLPNCCQPEAVILPANGSMILPWTNAFHPFGWAVAVDVVRVRVFVRQFRIDFIAVLDGNLGFNFANICETFAFIGFTLMLVQGGIVRRISGRIHEGTLAVTVAGLEIVGFLLLVWVTHHYSLAGLLAALAVTVSGFAFITPSLNSLISRRSDPAEPGAQFRPRTKHQFAGTDPRANGRRPAVQNSSSPTAGDGRRTDGARTGVRADRRPPRPGLRKMIDAG